MTKQPFIIIAGPTAVGKTNLSIQLAKKLGAEIISADSMQVYKHMDIGSAKVTPEEMDGVPHHLIDVLEPQKECNVVTFQQMAKQAMQEIYAKGRIPILAGGTGFYIQALLYDIDFSKEKESGLRETLQAFADANGALALHEKLKAVDPKSADQIHPNNVKRVIRAIEFFEQNGTPISEHNEAEQQKKPAYNSAYFVLTDERSHLYERIEQRVDLMLEQGLVEEVARLKEMGCTKDMISMQGLGYKEILAYLDNECSLEEAIYILKRDTRHFAKRQLTWFRRERDVIWIPKQEFQYDEEAILQFMIEELKRRGILC